MASQHFTTNNVAAVPSTCRSNLLHRVFSRLTVVGFSHKTNARYFWLCRCLCGTIKAINGNTLSRGTTTSCGCWRDEQLSRRRRTHQRSKTPVYHVWQGMINRCYNPNVKNFFRYGGRGIVVCDRWRHSFENFLADMGEKPSKTHSIERKNNDLGYSPENCKWATAQEQAINRRSCVNLAFHNKTQTVSRWATELGLPSRLIRRRLKLGWTVADALTVPPLGQGKRLSSIPQSDLSTDSEMA